MEFEWDEAKNIANQKKHGLDFLEATECFFDPSGIELKDDSFGWENLKKAEFLRSGIPSAAVPSVLLA
jgi:uncharacterized DUF497 family protein